MNLFIYMYSKSRFLCVFCRRIVKARKVDRALRNVFCIVTLSIVIYVDNRGDESLWWAFLVCFSANTYIVQGRIQDFKLGGAHLKKLRCVAQCILYCYVIYCHLCRQQGRIQVGGPKIGKNMIFWRKTEIFHTKYPKIFRASLRSFSHFWWQFLIWIL
jgi:hypothetical protein